ncbi:MAG: hypothetical protein KTR16_14310 [Acidiferrobacterales bacterium]|nr:hypothetical protein [Acidiferrobacterales bacterium]
MVFQHLSKITLATAIGLSTLLTQAKASDLPALEDYPKIQQVLEPYSKTWLDITDIELAEKIARPLAFDEYQHVQIGRGIVAWIYFIRATRNPKKNQTHKMDWLNWHTNNETFTQPKTDSEEKIFSHLVTPKAESAKAVGSSVPKDTCPLNFSPQAVTRNNIGFKYLNRTAKIWSRSNLATYLNNHGAIEMPIGSIELKGVFLGKQCIKSLPSIQSSEATFDKVRDDSGNLADLPMTGLHIMAKLAKTPTDPYTSNRPSWFWATFEYNNNPGLTNVRSMLTEPDALPKDLTKVLQKIAASVGVSSMANYSLSGTQVSFVTDQGGISILGSSKLEDFAGGNINAFPDYKKPEDWTAFDASCHACHSTAAFNPKTNKFFSESYIKDDFNHAFPLVRGPLPNSILEILKGKNTTPDSYNFKHLDFMWPITFQFLYNEEGDGETRKVYKTR